MRLRIREEGREAARQKGMTLGIVEWGVMWNQLGKWKNKRGEKVGGSLQSMYGNSGQSGGAVWL